MHKHARAMGFRISGKGRELILSLQEGCQKSLQFPPDGGLHFASFWGMLAADRFTRGGTERSTSAYLTFNAKQHSGKGTSMFLNHSDEPGEP